MSESGNKPRTSLFEYLEKAVKAVTQLPLVNEGRISKGATGAAPDLRETLKQVLDSDQANKADVLKALGRNSVDHIMAKLEGKTLQSAVGDADILGKIGLAGGAGLAALGAKDILSEDKHDKRHVFRGAVRVGLGFGFAAFAAATGPEWGGTARKWADQVTQSRAQPAQGASRE